MTDAVLRADCTRCAALCCVALAFDQSDLFAFDKAAGEPCRHLGADKSCAIHAQRAARGFGGCVNYDCLGAGQRVTQETFAGGDWRTEPALLAPMMSAFSLMQRLHRVLQLLREAAKLRLSPEEIRALRALEADIDALAARAASAPEADAAIEAAHAFLRTLKQRVSPADPIDAP